MKRVLAIGGVVALVAATAVSVYLYQQQRIDRLESKNNSQNRDSSAIGSDQTPTDSQKSAKSESAENSDVYTSEKGVDATIGSPVRNQPITSPLQVTGSVPGHWSYESQFNVRLVDAQGNLLAEAPATLQGNWMTDQLVEFRASLSFDPPTSQRGSLILIKANPSGQNSNDDTIVVPIRFN